MAVIDEYLDDIEKIKIAVENDKKKMFEAIDLDALLLNPSGYLQALGNEFINQHLDEIEKSYNTGKKFAEKILNEN